MHPEMAHSEASPAVIFDTLLAFQRTYALRAAIELDIFTAVGDGPGDVASIARHASASERGIRILCDYLVINGFLVKEDSRYLHTPTSAAFLDPRSPACMAPISKFMGNEMFSQSGEHLAEIVRTGRTVLPGDGSVEPDNPVWVDFARSMVPMVAPSASPLAEIVLAGRSGQVDVLDIAAGHGIFGIEIAKQNPEARITGLDWAAVLEVARENATAAGVADRYTSLPGSAFDVEYGGPYDVVLLTNFLHHFDKPTCTGLLKKIKAALKPGGCVATLEFVPNEDRVTPAMPAAFAMTMLTTTPSGDAYTLGDLEEMHKNAGFSEVTAHPIPMSPQSVVVGR